MKRDIKNNSLIISNVDPGSKLLELLMSLIYNAESVVVSVFRLQWQKLLRYAVSKLKQYHDRRKGTH